MKFSADFLILTRWRATQATYAVFDEDVRPPMKAE